MSEFKKLKDSDPEEFRRLQPLTTYYAHPIGPPTAIEIVPDSLELNPDFPPDHFILEFPHGVLIADEFTQNVYRAGGGPVGVQRHEVAAKPGTSSYSIYLIVLNVFVIIIIAVVIYYRKRMEVQGR